MTLPFSLNDWRAQARTFVYRGHEIAFWQGGDWEDRTRPALVLIHGFPTASYDWANQWTALCDRYRVAALDMIGFGFSAKPRDYAYSIMDQADLHEAFLDRLGLEAVHILAHDYGDTVAQELLARFLDRSGAGTPCTCLQSICFLNGGLFPEQHRATFTQRLLHSPVGPMVSGMMTRQRFGKGFSEVFGPATQPTAEELDVFWALLSAGGGMPAIGHKLIRYIAERRANRERWVGALQRSTIPMRVIDGAADPVSGAHMVARYRELVPAPDTVLLDGIGHYPQLEAPGAVLDAFLEFQSAIATA